MTLFLNDSIYLFVLTKALHDLIHKPVIGTSNMVLYNGMH